MATPVKRAAAVAALGCALIGVEIALRGETGLKGQILGQLIAFGLFLPAAWLAWRGLGIGKLGLVLVLGVAVVLRVAAFDPSGAPPLSTDVNRYAWDARVQAAGINPYRYAPTDQASSVFATRGSGPRSTTRPGARTTRPVPKRHLSPPAPCSDTG